MLILLLSLYANASNPVDCMNTSKIEISLTHNSIIL